MPRGCCVNHSNTHWPSEGGRRCPIARLSEPLLPLPGRHWCHQQVLSHRPIDAPCSDRFVRQPPTVPIVAPTPRGRDRRRPPNCVLPTTGGC
jgi:hypothetical protein